MRCIPDREVLFAAWSREHGGILNRTARSFARSKSELCELENELRLQLWNSTSSFEGTAQSSTWVYRVCLNTAITWNRTRRRHEARFDSTMDPGNVHASEASPHEIVGEQELLERLYGAIREIPAVERGLIFMSLDGLSYRQIGEIMGMSENHVGVGLTRARKLLTERMKGITHELA